MPTYLCHGFRWPRRRIRTFVFLNDVMDGAPGWVIGAKSSSSILKRLHHNFGDIIPPPPTPIPKKPTRLPGEKPPRWDFDFSLPPPRVPDSEDSVLTNKWSTIKLLEEYDPLNTVEPSRPYVYLADYVVRIDLSANVPEEMARYNDMAKQTPDRWLERLRDAMEETEEVTWYVVVCDEEDRPDEPAGADEEGSERSSLYNHYPSGSSNRPGTAATSKRPQTAKSQRPDTATTTKQPSLKHKSSLADGLRRLFTRRDP